MRGRECGGCSLCCRLLPMAEIGKPSGARCPKQCSTGCRIYDARPFACRVWSCRWLVDDAEADLKRPDRSHYVVDPLPDFVTVRDDATGQEAKLGVVQVWVDPAHPDAHREPGLRRYLARIGERQGYAALIRYSSRDGFTLFPPALTPDGQWIEARGGVSTREHTADEKLDALGALDLKVRL